MADFWESLQEWWKERTASPLYATFAISVILWNWKFFYTLFFLDQASLSIPKIEYVQQRFLVDNILFEIGRFFILPTLSSYIAIRWLPNISSWAHQWSTIFYIQRKSYYDKKNLEYERERNKKLEELAEIKEKQVETSRVIEASSQEIEKNLSKDEKWQVEFDEFINSPQSISFRQVMEVVYEHDGQIFDNYSNTKNIQSRNLALADATGLVTIKGNSLGLTDKGKFFAKKFLEKQRY